MTQSPKRIEVGSETSDATGATNPYDRAKVYVAYGYGLSGAGVKVGVVDSGFNLVDGKPAHNEFASSGKIQVLKSTGSSLKSDSHGSHVSGLAVGERNGTTMMGVAYNATLFLGMSPQDPVTFTALFNEYRTSGVTVSSNSYGQNVEGDANSPWKPVLTSTSGGYEVTAKNALAYRDANKLTSAQMMANIAGGTAEEWTTTIASMKAYQNAGGVVVWANSNYGPNEIANGGKGLDETDLGASLPLAFSELSGGWITVVNATSAGLIEKENGEGWLQKATKKEGNIVLNSAPCGLAASFCVSMDGVALWSASNKGVATYEAQTGTSQATPEVAGMVALLREAFPTASAADLAARLMYTADNGFFVNNRTVSTISTATYTNANGSITHQVSDIWGHGFPDLQKALMPVGTTTTRSRGKTVTLASLADSVTMGGAFGSGSALSRATVLYNDQLNGVFGTTLGTMTGTARTTTIADAAIDQVASSTMATASTGNGLTFSFGQTLTPDSAARPARLQTLGAIDARFANGLRLAAGFGGRGIAGALALQGNERAPAGVSLADRAQRLPLLAMNDVRQQWALSGVTLGGLRLTGGAFASDDRAERRSERARGEFARTGGYLVDAGYDFAGGALAIGATLGTLDENGSFLGSVMPTRIGSARAGSRFARMAVRAQMARSISLNASWMGATSDIRLSGDGPIGDIGRVRSNAFAADVRFDDVAGRDSRVTLGLSQPLRVGGGAGTVALPSQVLIHAPGQYEYLTSASRFDLAPSGREIDITAEFAKRLTSGLSFNVSAMAIRNPGHDATAPLGYAGLSGFKLGF